jgi:hypothetical protein
MPRRVVTPENLSRDFIIDLEREDGPVGLNLDPAHFQRDPETGEIRVIGGGGDGGGAIAVSADGVIVHVAPSDINFVGAGVVDDGDGTVTVTVAPGGAGSSVSNDGLLVLAAPTDINFVGATVADDADGTVTVTVDGTPVSASMDGAIVHIAPFDFNFVGLNVADDGNGSLAAVSPVPDLWAGWRQSGPLNPCNSGSGITACHLAPVVDRMLVHLKRSTRLFMPSRQHALHAPAG